MLLYNLFKENKQSQQRNIWKLTTDTLMQPELSKDVIIFLRIIIESQAFLRTIFYRLGQDDRSTKILNFIFQIHLYNNIYTNIFIIVENRVNACFIPIF